jgi:hypothetical protein
MGIWDFFTPDAGQKRRQWLNQNMNAPIDEAMRYYLGAGNSVHRSLDCLLMAAQWRALTVLAHHSKTSTHLIALDGRGQRL